jgi:hypothetical protein
MYFLILVLATLLNFNFSVSAQSKFIIYDLPEGVTDKVKEYIIENKNCSRFVAKLSVNTDMNYVLSIIDNSEPLDADNLINERIIKKTNRRLRINENCLLPLILEEDLIFADFGREKQSDGRIARKKLLFNFDGFTITFDKLGRIY